MLIDNNRMESEKFLPSIMVTDNEKIPIIYIGYW